jgi:uncharacterized membrane protein YfcA
MMSLLPLILGAFVGFSLGLTGGGGAIFAVPLLVYGIGVPPRDAVGISLMTVGTTAFVGFVQRARRHQVEFPTGLLFALAGMIGAPIGAWSARYLSDAVLLGVFSLLMLVIATRMWTNARRGVNELSILDDTNDGPTCRRDEGGELRFTSNCALLLAAIGLIAGVLTGLFGVGGGVIIVPALVMFSNMGMQRAIGTSLLIITLVSASGVASHVAAGKGLSIAVAGMFTLGSVMGLFAGSGLSLGFSGPALQKTFSAAIVVVALYVVVRTLLS